MINNVKKEHSRGNKTLKALHNLTQLNTIDWELELIVSNKIDVDSKAKKDRQSELKHEIDCNKYIKRKSMHNDNECKVCSDL